jgi:hypothetical protein
MLRNVAPYCLAVIGMLLIITGIAAPVLASAQCPYLTQTCYSHDCQPITPSTRNWSQCYNPGWAWTETKDRIDHGNRLMTTAPYGGYRRGTRYICEPNQWTEYCGDRIVEVVPGAGCTALTEGAGGFYATYEDCP